VTADARSRTAGTRDTPSTSSTACSWRALRFGHGGECVGDQRVELRQAALRLGQQLGARHAARQVAVIEKTFEP
jgi:hypothetical protein